jgi:hypothetical protein
VIAYCAPGTRALASLILALRGEHADEIAETPVLDGQSSIILVTEPDPQPLPPFPTLAEWPRLPRIPVPVFPPPAVLAFGSVTA